MHKIASTQQSAGQIAAAAGRGVGVVRRVGKGEGRARGLATWLKRLETGPKRKFEMSTNEQTKFHLQRIVNCMHMCVCVSVWVCTSVHCVCMCVYECI